MQCIIVAFSKITDSFSCFIELELPQHEHKQKYINKHTHNMRGANRFFFLTYPRVVYVYVFVTIH